MNAPPTCFVVMPYGRRPVEDVELDFDTVYDRLIAPAARAAGFEPVRSDRDQASGVILPRMFERLWSAELVIADISYQNPNVYYELGLRHALRPQGTLLIRRGRGDLGVTPLPARRRGGSAEAAFDIKGITICSYDAAQADPAPAVDALAAQIRRVAAAIEPDSPAFLYLEGLRVVTGNPRPHAREDRSWEVVDAQGRPTGRCVGYRSGDLRELRDARAVDYWVNSENVLMQMARIYERSVSSTIRALGAMQPEPQLPGFDDTIADDLRRQLGPRQAVNPGEVLVTTSGRLRETHGVRAVLHAATVTGAPGRGFQPIGDDLIVEALRNVLACARTLARGGGAQGGGRSLVMPLFATGQGRLDPLRAAERLVGEVVQDLAYHAGTLGPDAPDLRCVLFSAFTKEHVALLQRCLGALAARGALRPAPDLVDAGH